MKMCSFDVAWSKCRNDAEKGHQFCRKHQNHKPCLRCKSPSVRECSMSGSLVCGAPLCASCRCTCMGQG